MSGILRRKFGCLSSINKQIAIRKEQLAINKEQGRKKEIKKLRNREIIDIKDIGY